MPQGRCLCKSVALSIAPAAKTFTACRCGMCRKWSGAPAFSVDVDGALKIEGEVHVLLCDSSPWAQRGFCKKKCGTHRFCRLIDGSFSNVPLGLLDGGDAFAFATQIFIDRKPSCYNFAESTEVITEAEIFAKFIPQT